MDSDYLELRTVIDKIKRNRSPPFIWSPRKVLVCGSTQKMKQVQTLRGHSPFRGPPFNLRGGGGCSMYLSRTNYLFQLDSAARLKFKF